MSCSGSQFQLPTIADSGRQWRQSKWLVPCHLCVRPSPKLWAYPSPGHCRHLGSELLPRELCLSIHKPKNRDEKIISLYENGWRFSDYDGVFWEELTHDWESETDFPALISLRPFKGNCTIWISQHFFKSWKKKNTNANHSVYGIPLCEQTLVDDKHLIHVCLLNKHALLFLLVKSLLSVMCRDAGGRSRGWVKYHRICFTPKHFLSAEYVLSIMLSTKNFKQHFGNVCAGC